MKHSFLFLVLSLWAGITFAQSDEEVKERPNGVRVGYMSSDLLGDGEDTHAGLNNFYIGYIRKMGLVPLLHMETGLEYMIAGAEVEEDTKLTLHYVGIPAQAVFSIGPFVAQGGLTANFKVGETYNVDGETVDRDDKGEFFDLDANLGAGFNILFMMVEARHYWGLIDVEEGYHNDYWQLGLKFHF